MTSVDTLRAVIRPASCDKGLTLTTSIPLVSAATLVVGLLFLALLPRAMAVDGHTDYAWSYAPVARSVMAGNGIRLPDGEPALRYPPGYPLLLATAFTIGNRVGADEATAALALNMVAFCASGVLLFALAARLWGPRRAWLAWMVWATYPLTLYLLKQPNSELPFLAMLLGTAYAIAGTLAVQRWWLWMFCGVLTGATMLIRPIAIGLGAVFASLALLAAPQRRAQAALLLVAGNVMAVAPWETWAFVQSGRIIPLSTGGVNGVLDGLTFAVRDKGFRDGAWAPSAAVATMRRLNDRDPELTTFGAVAAALSAEVVDAPRGVIELGAVKALRSWYATDSQRGERLTLIIQVFYLVLLLAATRSALQIGGTARHMAIGAWVVTSYFWALTVASLSIVRYMVPPINVLFVLIPALFWRNPPTHLSHSHTDHVTSDVPTSVK